MRKSQILGWIVFIGLVSLGLAGCQNTLSSVPSGTNSGGTPAPTSGSGDGRSPSFSNVSAGNLWVSLAWTPVSGATSYNLYFGDASAKATLLSPNRITGITGSRVTLANAGSTVATLGSVGTVNPATTKLTNGATYYFVVTSVTATGESLASSWVSVVPNQSTGLGAPTPTAIVGEGTVSLSWAAMANADSYNVYYVKAGTADTTSPSRITGIGLTGVTLATVGSTIVASDGTVADGSVALSNGDTFSFVVSSVGASGESAGSTPALSVSPVVGTVAPLAPVMGQAVAGDQSVALTWGAVPGAKSYSVYYAQGVSPTALSTNKIAGITGTATQLTTSGSTILSSALGGSVAATSVPFANGKPYSFVVTAVNSGGESGLSSIVTVTPSLYVGGTVLTKLTIAGNVSTVAGQYDTTIDKDAAIGINAVIRNPGGLATDGKYLYVRLAQGQDIRKVGLTSPYAVSTLPSNGIGYGSDDYITTDGTYLYTTGYATTSYTVRQISLTDGRVTSLAGSLTSGGVQDGTGPAAYFNAPKGITTDGVNLYVVDTQSIRKVVIATGAVSTLAGPSGSSYAAYNITGTVDAVGSAARFNYPRGITTDGKFLYVGDYNNGTIRKVNMKTGAVTTLCGGVSPTGDLTNDGGYIYFVDDDHQLVQKVEIATGTVTAIAGTKGTSGHADGFGTAATFRGPWGVTSDGTKLFVGDYGGCLIRAIQ